MYFNDDEQASIIDTLFEEPPRIQTNYNQLIVPPVQSRSLPNLGPLPRYSAIIGVCEDGLPLLFDLSNPVAGCILILGGAHTGKGQLLKSILLSAALLNPPRDVNYYIVTPHPGNYSDLAVYDHCSGIYSSYERASRELIIELAAIAEQRKSGRHMGAMIVLAIDDLYTFIKDREFEVDLHLKWLLKHGPNNGVWCIATLQTESISKLRSEHIISFKTRLIANSYPLALEPGNKLPPQNPYPDTFKTQVGSQSIQFWIPDLE